MMAHDYLNKLAVARTSDGALVAVGRVVGYCDVPTVLIETADGKQVHWRADMSTISDLPNDAVEALLPRRG